MATTTETVEAKLEKIVLPDPDKKNEHKERDRHFRKPRTPTIITAERTKYMKDQVIDTYHTRSNLRTAADLKNVAEIAKARKEESEATAKIAERDNARKSIQEQLETKFMTNNQRHSLHSTEQKAPSLRGAPKAGGQRSHSGSSQDDHEKRKALGGTTKSEEEELRLAMEQEQQEASIAGYLPGQPQGYNTQFQPEHEIIPSKGHIPSWAYLENKGEDDYDSVTVDTDARERLPSEGRPRAPKYNVSLGVKPKDIADVYRRKTSEERNRPKGKMYNVSMDVHPKNIDQVQAQDEADVPSGKRKDAYTLARPQGYRTLKLNVPVIGDSRDQGDNCTQVDEFDIDKSIANRQGRHLKEGNTIWPLNREFTVEVGMRKVEDYIRRTWKLDKEWIFNVRFLQSHCTNYFRKFIFEAVFSNPTVYNPVPPATASVFFVIEVGHYASLDDTVKVSYVLEGMRYVQKPGKIPFHSKWLKDIIADKLRVQRASNF